MSDFADRMKEYEVVESGRRLMPTLPAICRLDGRCFSRFTKGLGRPYDKRLSELMTIVTCFLVDDSCASMGYTQSDEITLAWYAPDRKTQIFFDGKIQKMVSILASMATVHFFNLMQYHLPEKAGSSPMFDCRLWNVPNTTEGANCFLHRENDATKNSIIMAAGEYYSHKQLMNKNGGEQQEMLFQKGVNWNDYPVFFKRGTYIQRRRRFKCFSQDEIEKLPPMHEARKNPELTVERSEVFKIEMPPLATVTNREQVIFSGALPETDTDQPT